MNYEPINVHILMDLYNDQMSYFNIIPLDIIRVITTMFENDIITSEHYIEDWYKLLNENKIINLQYTMLFNGKSIIISKNIEVLNVNLYISRYIYDNENIYSKILHIHTNDINRQLENVIYKIKEIADERIILYITDKITFDNFKAIKCYPKI